MCLKLYNIFLSLPSHAAVIHSVIPPDMTGDLGVNLRVSLNVSYGFVLNGTSVTLECTAESSETVNFAWTFKGRKLPDNAAFTSSNTRSLLTITNFMKDNTGKYTCFAMSGSGSTRSAGDRTGYLEVDCKLCSIVAVCF